MSVNGNGHRNGTGITRHTPAADLPELLLPEEAAAWLGVGRNTIYELVRRGDIKSQKLGRLIRIPKSALVELAP
jgi:excisionase family DNA binding protein